MSQGPLNPGALDIASNGRPRAHRGDTMSPETRSRVMKHIKGKGTEPELLLARELRRAGLRWISHDPSLVGRPDFVFRQARVAVFVDGDFWHGWRFSLWCHKLSQAWEEKIQKNRDRDRRVHRKLRRLGWAVLRIWEHQINKDASLCAEKIKNKIRIQLINHNFP